MALIAWHLWGASQHNTPERVPASLTFVHGALAVCLVVATLPVLSLWSLIHDRGRRIEQLERMLHDR